MTINRKRKAVDALHTNRESCNSKQLSPYWTTEMKNLSANLSDNTVNGCFDLQLGSYNSSVDEAKSNSWCNVRYTQSGKLGEYQKINYPDPIKPKETQPVTNSTKKKPSPNSCRRIKLLLTKEQKDHLHRAFFTARFTYNEVVNALKTEKLTKQQLRARFVYDAAFEDKPWVRLTPSAIRDGALLDVLKAVKSSIAQHRKTGRPFEIHHKSRKNQSDSIAINHRCWNDGILFPRLWSKHRLRSAEPIPPKLDYDCRLQKTHLNEFYLCIPCVKTITNNSQVGKSSCIALDPGQ